MEYRDEACKDLLVAWLNDAYSLEKSLVQVLEHHAKDFKDHPEAQNRLLQHAEQTRHHADIVENCIDHLGESVSSVKGGMGTMLGQMKSVSTGWAKDELIKDLLADCASEHFEIACYKSLISAAELYGDRDIAQACRDILREEEEMARWCEAQIPIITEEMLRIQIGNK